MTASSLGTLWNRLTGKKPAAPQTTVVETAAAPEPEVAIEHVEHHVSEENIREVTGGDQEATPPV
jgi:hypothetical protein